MELERIFSLKPLLEELGNGHLPFMCLQHTDSDGVQHQIPAVYLGKVDSLNTSKVKTMVSLTWSTLPLHSCQLGKILNFIIKMTRALMCFCVRPKSFECMQLQRHSLELNACACFFMVCLYPLLSWPIVFFSLVDTIAFKRFLWLMMISHHYFWVQPYVIIFWNEAHIFLEG